MRGILLLLFALVLLPASVFALEPDELLLVVNANVPAGEKAAEFYTKARLIPDGRICKLDLPDGEEIPYDQYECKVVPPIRDFIRKNGLESKIKCLVTFYGMPIRIGSKTLSPAENSEIADVKSKLNETAGELMPAIDEVEKLATDLDPHYVPDRGRTLADLNNRVNRALTDINQHLPGADDPRHMEILKKLIRLIALFGGDGQVAEKLSDTEATQLMPPEKAAVWPARRQLIQKEQSQLQGLEEKRYDASARDQLRAIVKDGFGLLSYASLLQAQLEYLQTDGTVSAVDSELALLWWNYYSRAKWQPNPLHYRFTGPKAHTLMVSRLDGPKAETVTRIILDSLRAEKDGLKGSVVIDSTGGAGPDGKPDTQGGYRAFDNKLLALAKLVENRTQLSLVLDTHPAVLAPHSAKDVALYCGWYSVRNYVPCCQFVPGAVGFHIASYEMVSLKNPAEKGWVPGLLNDGIAGTLGSIAEPYLASFPSPEEFFPLLMTGKLTLAEVYWKTEPMTSWMQSLIGDPLYTPYKTNPALKVEDLPVELQSAVKSTAPAAP